MRISLDPSKCQGHAQCHGIDEELFPVDAMGYSSLETHPVGYGDEERARRGVAACPEQALILTDDDADAR